MNIHMGRTTLVIDEQRLIDLKRLAAARRTTLSAVVDEFLREGLARVEVKKKRKLPALPRALHMGRELIDISDRDQLYEVLDKP